MAACAPSRCSSTTWSNVDGDRSNATTSQLAQALDPRVAYLVTSMLEDVINHGTGATVRARGFIGPAAGKTGTSRDGWFAGYTSNLLCIVWVGFDDNRDLGLSGANAPAPIWAEFMKRAVALPAYHDVQPFDMPDGVTQVTIDPETLAAGHAGLPGHARGSLHPRAPSRPSFARCTADACQRIAAGSWLSRIFGGGDKPKGADSRRSDWKPGDAARFE